MVFKFLEKTEVLYQSEEFCIKEASWNEARKLHNIFRETISLAGPWTESPGKKLTLVAIDNETKAVIGGLESAVNMKLASADLASFAVLPEFRKTASIGTKLLETTLEELKKNGIKQVTATPTDKSWKIFRDHGLDYPPALKDEIRKKHLDESGCVEGAKMVISPLPDSFNTLNKAGYSHAEITVDPEKMVNIRVKSDGIEEELAQLRILRESQNFVIRAAKPNEMEDLHRLFKEYISDVWGLLTPVKNGFAIVAVDKNNRVVGGIEREVDLQSGSAKAVGFVLVPEFRGKDIGKLLVRIMDEELKKMGVKHVAADGVASEATWKILTEQRYTYTKETTERMKREGKSEKEFIFGDMEKDL
jgi:predicted N-acetyltransferase YhbS